MTDFEAALEKAAKEKKDVLMDFTGSDWCGWCIKLREEVFGQEVFKTGVADTFVLVEVDFPQDASKLNRATRDQNEELAEKYSIEGYPTIVLADAQGRPYAHTGYEPGGAERYLKLLDGLRDRRVARDRALKEAAKLQGVEKARVLLNALDGLSDADLDTFYSELVMAIALADPKDQTGFQRGRAYRRAVGIYEGKIEGLFALRDYEAAIEAADTFIERHHPRGEDRQHILMAKVMAYAELGKEEEAYAQIELIRAAAPDSELSTQLDTIKTQIEAYLKEKLAAPAPEKEGAPNTPNEQ